MSMTTTTASTAAIKKVLGFAHTDNLKGIGNEALRTGFSVCGSTVFATEIPANPSKAALYTITGGTVEFVRLKMVADLTSNGKSYHACLPDDYQSLTSNAKKALAHFANGTKLADTAGKVQIIPSAYGLNYEAIPYSGGTGLKGTGTVIPPADARDWILDVFNGVFFQQGSGGTDSTVSYLECFIWVGDFVTDRFNEATEFTTSSNVIADTSSYYLVDSQNAGELGVAKWFISCIHSSTNSAISMEVNAMKCQDKSSYNRHSTLKIGGHLIDVNVDIGPSGELRLLAKPDYAGLVVNVKRLMVK